MVTCARCGKEIKPALMSRTKVWTPQVGEFKGKQICQECYDQIQPELERLLREMIPKSSTPQIKDQPGPIIDNDAQLKILIANILNNYDRSLKGSRLATIGLALTDDRAMWNVTLLKSIGELLKASLYYDELLLRKLNAIQQQLAGTETKEKTSG
jgi:hypothetical protein